MKKTFLRVINLVLCLSLLMGGSAFASAEGEDTAPDTSPTRISVVFNGDASTSRGIYWYTKANTSSLVVIVEESGNPVKADIKYAEVF